MSKLTFNRILARRIVIFVEQKKYEFGRPKDTTQKTKQKIGDEFEKDVLTKKQKLRRVMCCRGMVG